MKRLFEHYPRLRLTATYALIYLVTMTLTRAALLLWGQGETFPGMGALLEIFAIGLVYDLAFFTYFLIPFALVLGLLPNRVFNWHPVRWLLLIGLGGFVYGTFFEAVAEWFFWEEFAARFNFISVDYLIYRSEVTQNIYESYPVVPILIVIGLLTLLTLWLLRRPLWNAFGHHVPLRHRTLWTGALLLLALPAYFQVDQTLLQFSPNRFFNELAGNGPYQFFAAFRNNELPYPRFYRTLAEREADTLLRQLLAADGSRADDPTPYQIRRTIAPVGAERPLNVMLVTVESLSASFLGSFGNAQQLTPNLDRLAAEGMLFTRLYATGTRTTRGLEAVTLSIPPTPGRSIVKRPHQEGHYNISSEFQQRGYDVAFFYGGRGYFDNMNSFFSHNGYRIVDQSDLAADEVGFANAWGVADEYIYGRMLREASRAHAAGRHFFFHFMTTSNHRPYTFPDGRIDLPPGSRAAAVKYTDWAIGNFIAAARQEPWFAETLFVFIADHCASSAGKQALNTPRYHIPLILYAPEHIAPQRIDTLASQIDLAPTLLGLLNFRYASRFFGADLTRLPPERGRALIGNYQYLGLLQEDHLTYLKPRAEVGYIDGAATDAGTEIPLPATALAQLQADIAYYQGADAYESRHLGRWEPVQQVEVRE